MTSHTPSLLQRYGDIEQEAITAVLTPQLVEINSIDKNVFKINGQTHYRASFTVAITESNIELMQRGMTGKFVPQNFAEGGVWKEICKGRIIDIENNIARGEIYIGSKGGKKGLEDAIKDLSENDFLEIDQYGASPKILSSLAEYHLAQHAKERGYIVKRMPEDTAKHLGCYYNYDFEFTKNGVTKKIEAKSIWGTDTNYARLIHSTTPKPKGDEASWTDDQKKNYYPTSSCKFDTQDIFAVSLFLRTGNIKDFAFAVSVSDKQRLYGLPANKKYPNHVNQNPKLNIGDGIWFTSIDDVWNLIK